MSSEVNLVYQDGEKIDIQMYPVAMPDSRTVQARQQAIAAKDAAEASQLAAKASEDNAKISEDNAKTSEDNAKTSEDNAKDSEDAAKISEDNAKDSELAAAQSASDAKDSADAAALSASTASSTIVDSMGGTETNKAPSVSSVKAYISTTFQSSIHYLGESSTDGSWRLNNDSGVLKIEKRVSGSWVTISEFTA